MGDVRIVTYFNNRVAIARWITRGKAVNLMLRESRRRFVPPEAELLEVCGVSNIFIVPTTIWFFIDAALPMRRSRPSKHALYKREGGRCAYCGEFIRFRAATIDHVLPRSRGGDSSWNNLALACRRCNLRKGHRTLTEVGMKLRITPRVPRKHREMH